MDSSEPLDPRLFRRAMGRWPTGVSVVTSRDGELDAGLTVNAFLSVALEPPLVLVSLTVDADSTPIVDRAGRFAVNLLAADQRELSERFARQIPLPEKFDRLPMHRGLGGVPLLDGTLAGLECVVRSSFDVEDHRVFVGEVVRLHLGRDVPPLLFYHSQYASPEPDGRLRLPEPRA